MRNAKELLIASKVFTVENRGLSWWYLLSSLALYLATLAIACSQLPYWVRIPSSMINGLIIVRLFIIYHDYHHGAILRRSWVAGLILRFYGLFVLSPSSVWNHSHEHHHRHNSRSSGPNVGSFPLMTTDEFLRATPIKRFVYAASRHPINIMMGYLTVFLFGMTIRTFISHPKEHWDSLLALVLHVVLLGVCLSFGWSVMILAMIVPLTIACGLGAYLFYAQHNFPACQLHRREDWSYVKAALTSSSYIQMNRIMHWFTGNVGYHHVHHLNAKIPFYRLPEAMSELVELQHPGTTSLRFADIQACFSLKLWDPERQQLVSFRDAARSLPAAAEMSA